jgi:hypothetical protein
MNSRILVSSLTYISLSIQAYATPETHDDTIEYRLKVKKKAAGLS